jgi:hypothetical protein
MYQNFHLHSGDKVSEFELLSPFQNCIHLQLKGIKEGFYPVGFIHNDFSKIRKFGSVTVITYFNQLSYRQMNRHTSVCMYVCMYVSPEECFEEIFLSVSPPRNFLSQILTQILKIKTDRLS